MRVRYVYIILVLFVGGYLSFKFAQIFGDSLFFKNKDRINMVIYGQQSALYSIDTNESRHYVLYFPPDLKMQVPGGYGNYRVGSLGKLAKLDGNPDIYRKTFALATTAFVDYYFYQDSPEVYYGNEAIDKVTEPALYKFITYSSTASDVASYFGCALIKGKTDVYDIIFVLGNLEKDWEVL